jgi:hypothetical protein
MFGYTALANIQASLPHIDGDWHEFESKQRNKRRHGVVGGSSASSRPPNVTHPTSTHTSTAVKRTHDELTEKSSTSPLNATPERKRIAVASNAQAPTQAISVTMLEEQNPTESQ